MRFIIILFLLCSILSCQSKSSKRNNFDHSKIDQNEVLSKKNNQIVSSNTEVYYVYKVVDGDTFYCYDMNKNELKVRLIGIDTPETRNRFKKKKGYYGEEAKKYLTNFILNQSVKLEFDLDKYDQYNRVLAYAYLGDKFINAELVKHGYARIMTIQPNSKYAELFYDLQINARENKIGLWAVEEY